MSKCKIIKSQIEAEIKQLASTSNLDMSNLLELARKIPCRVPSAYNIHMGECMKEKGNSMKTCVIEWNEKKALLLEKEKNHFTLEDLPKELTWPKFTSFVAKKGLTPKDRSALWKQYTAPQEVLTEVSGEDIRAKASYHPQTDTTSIAVTDEDPEKIQIIAQSIPMKAEKVIVEELPSGGVTTIKTEGKEEVATVVSDLPTSIKKSKVD